ncbi:AMP-binding protein, partial [Mycobacterium montefiorense]
MLNYGVQPDLLGPLTAGQWAIWAAQQLLPEVPYNFAGFLALGHDVDAERLFVACESAVTCFGSPCARIAVVDGEPVYVVDRAFAQSLHCVDLRAEADAVAAARKWMENDYCHPVDLFRDRLINLALLRITDDLSYFYFRMHHVLMDGYAANNFLRHVAAVYSGESPDTGEIDFSGFAAIRNADQKYQQSSRSQADAEYWKTVVRGPLKIADLAGTQRWVAPRHPLVRELVCPQLLSEDRHDLSDISRVVAAMAVFIAKTTGLQDVSLSLPVSARMTAALKKSAGMVSNLVPLFIRVDDGDTIGTVTDQAAQAVVGALRHQQFRRWPDLVADAGRPGMNVEFGQVINIFTFAAPLHFGPSEAIVNVLTTFPVQDVAVNIYPQLSNGSQRIQFGWNPDRYTADEIAGHIRRLESLFDRLLIADPSVVVGGVPLLDAGEHTRLDTWGNRAVLTQPVTGISIPELFATQVARTPDAVALTYQGQSLTYRELDESSNRLAHLLFDHGVGPGQCVALLFTRSAQAITAIVAVLKTGAAYLPIDPAVPDARIEFMLSDATPIAALTTAKLTERLAGYELTVIDVNNPHINTQPTTPLSWPAANDIAYVIYTSGTTGTPKGVAITHHNVTQLIESMTPQWPSGPEQTWSQCHSYAFDVSVWEIFGALLHGSRLTVVPESVVHSPQDLHTLLITEQVTVLSQTPSAAAALPLQGLESVTLVVAGEACLPEVVDRWAPGRVMTNAYGPTETTVYAAASAPLRPESGMVPI